MAYAPLNNIASPDTYTAAATVFCPGAQRVNFDVNNAAIYFQLGFGLGGVDWHPEVFLGPAFRSLDALPGADRVCDAVRVRSAVPGSPAQVTVHPR